MKRAHQWRRIWLLAISFFALLRSPDGDRISAAAQSTRSIASSFRCPKSCQAPAIGASCRLIPYIPWRQIAFFFCSPIATAIGRWNQPLSHQPASQSPFGPETAFSSAQKLHIQRKLAVCRHDARGRRAAMLGTWMLGCPMVWQVYLRMGGWVLFFCCIVSCCGGGGGTQIATDGLHLHRRGSFWEVVRAEMFLNGIRRAAAAAGVAEAGIKQQVTVSAGSSGRICIRLLLCLFDIM